MANKDSKTENDLGSFGAHILARDYLANWETQQQRNREMLSHALNLRDTIVFVGAGCSIPLGYPSWKELATRRAIPLTRRVIQAAEGVSNELKARCERRLDELEQRVHAGRQSKSRKRQMLNATVPELSAADLTSILGICEKVCAHCGASSDFRQAIARLFRLKKRRPGSPTAYDLLAQLPVHRFISSNYDCELEAALVRRWGLNENDYDFGSKAFGKKSFAQTAKYDEQLAIFSIAFAGYERKVFHCHGWHHEPESMVLTEYDYQQWYFRDQAIGARYRQTIDLIFNSNPLLFVGFSLSDDDLLIPLRFLSAVDRSNKYTRPIFALLEKSTLNNESRFDQLYERYGIHVVTYDAPVQTRGGRALAMCQEIKAISERCQAHRKAWVEYPNFRRVESQPGQTFLHYRPLLLDAPTLKREKGDQGGFWPDFRHTHLVWIVGPGGTGKSWEAIRQIERLKQGKKSSGYRGFFFWSFRYCNDALSGIEHALRFMGEKVGSAEHLLDQLVEQLRTKRYFVVLDGIERFLCQKSDQPTVSAIDSSCERFFAALADTQKNLKSVLVLTSRILPSVFDRFADPAKANHGVAVLKSKGFDLGEIESILRANNAGSKNNELAKHLYTWFRGHRYGVTLAAEWLKNHEFSKLEYEMAESDPEHRVSKMIGLALRAIRETNQPTAQCACELLERFAVFVEPVDTQIASVCLDASQRDHFQSAISLLKAKNLLFEVLQYDRQTRYLVHPSTREYIFHHDHHSSPADLPSFSLSGFTSAAATIFPGDRQSAGKRTVVSLFESLTKEASRLDGRFNSHEQVELCRAAFGVVRSRMVATTITRWSRYDEYLRFLVNVIDAVRSLSRSASRSRAALYADELAWLYNEAGLAYYGEGSMLDAIAVWDQSYEINRRLDEDNNGHHLFQSLCNLGGAYIHFGKLQNAESYLHKAIEMGRKLEESDHVARIEVYLALLCHLRGNIGEANDKYRIVTEKLRTLGNMRAYSIALRHHADLLLKQDGTRAEACEKIQTSKAVAETNSYHDLVAYARLSYGHLHRVEKKFPDAIREYRIALELARIMGLRRLEAEAQSELARVDLDLGDSQVARRRAMKALQIANEHLLGLRQTHCLVILGKATIHAGERELGVHYLRYAKRLADVQEYHLRANEAEAALYEIGEPIENSDVESIGAA